MKSNLQRLISAVLPIALLLAAIMTGNALAQATQGEPPQLDTTDRITAARNSIDAARGKIEDLRKREDAVRFDDAALVEIQLDLEDIVADMDEVSQNLQPRLDAIKAREEALGEPPGESEPSEPEALVGERRSLATERALINADIGGALAVSEQAGQMAKAVTTYRRTLFRQTILGRADISLQSLRNANKALVFELGQLGSRISNWAAYTWHYKRSALLSALFLTFVLGVVFAYGEYQFASRVMVHDLSDDNPSAFHRQTLAFWSTLFPVLGLTIFCTLAIFFLNSFDVLSSDIAGMLIPLLQFIVLVFFVSRLATAVLAPLQPSWRLVRVSDRGAGLLWWLVVAMAFVNAGDYLAGSISEVLDSPLILTVAKSFLATVIIGVILVITSFIHPMADEDGTSRPWPKVISLPLLVLGLALIFLPLFGFVGLARFVATQVVILGALLVTMYLGFLAARAVSEPEAFVGSSLGRLLSQRLHFGQVAVEQLGLLCGLCLYLLVLACGLPIIFLLWGFQFRDIQNWIQDSLSSITIGSVTISVTGILLGLLVFLVGYFVTRWFQRWADENVMRRGRMEAGLRNSIRTAIGYAGVALAAVIGLTVAGLNLSNLALVAGALSLGIGFGLQNIVNNFVSGLILLAERPFKVGDWVETASTQGFVKHISVRATEIETFQRQSIIVPNSELINSPVGNWTHRNRQGRAEIAVGVSYDSDPKQVVKLLEEIGQTNDQVLSDPPPHVVFTGFGDSSLDFELRVYLRDVLSIVIVGTDLRLKIFERFNEEGIEIPFPQRDLHIKMPADGGNEATEQIEEAVSTAVPSTDTSKRQPGRPADPDQ